MPIFNNDHRKIDTNKESSAVFTDSDFGGLDLLLSTYDDKVFQIIYNCRMKFDERGCIF